MSSTAMSYDTTVHNQSSHSAHSAHTYSGIVLELAYNLIKVKIEGIEGLNKVVYIHKFPPANGTTISPDLSTSSDSEELVPNTRLKEETVRKFWSNKNKYQANGDWKGGEFGSNNLPLTDKTFCYGIFIGMQLEIQIIRNGIIPYKTRCSKPFEPTDEIIPQTETFAWSSNITFIKEHTRQSYSAYVCDSPMPQSAIDVLFIAKIGDKLIVKILKRGGSHPNVDMPEMFMPGAGEHREPGLIISFKADVLRAVYEEIGLSPETLSQCYLLDVGAFSDPKRDPRYWTWAEEQDGEIITFGINRYSSTSVHILYIESPSGTEPVETSPADTIEVGQKMWVDLDDPWLTNPEIWMIPEHAQYFAHANKIIREFGQLTTEEKNTKKICL